MSYLRPEDVDHFFVKVLQISDWKIIFDNFNAKPTPEKLELLRKIVKAQVQNVYFQNVTMASVPQSEKRAPTLSDIIDTGSSGIGGVCIQVNYFLRLVLNFLGYDAFTVAADMHSSTLRDNHCVTIVRLTENELYLVDVACALPNCEPIPLHALPFRGFGGYPFEFRCTPDGTYQRVQLKGSFTKGDFPDANTEQIRYSFTVEPRKLEDFHEPMTTIFTTSETIFLQSLFLFRHFEEKQDENKSHFILIWGTTVVIGGSHGCTASQYKTYDEIVPLIKEYFPVLKDNEVEVALNLFREVQQNDSSYNR